MFFVRLKMYKTKYLNKKQNSFLFHNKKLKIFYGDKNKKKNKFLKTKLLK